jgi:hypothetical protein
MAKDTADALITKLKGGNPTAETLEAARALLKAHKFTQISDLTHTGWRGPNTARPPVHDFSNGGG